MAPVSAWGGRAGRGGVKAALTPGVGSTLRGPEADSAKFPEGGCGKRFHTGAQLSFRNLSTHCPRCPLWLHRSPYPDGSRGASQA